MKHQQQFEHFLKLLQKWNRTYNLTAIIDPKEMWTHHILDSLSIDDYLQGEKILDVGTGAGLPGIPLAIQNPQKHFTLLDGNGKKTRFCQQAVIELGLNNVTVVHSRIEKMEHKTFDTIISRAFTSLTDFYELCSLHLVTQGQLVAMKGQLSDQELNQLPEHIHATVHSVHVPQLNAERCVVILKPTCFNDVF